MALGYSEYDDVPMAFPAKCVQFGRFKVQPIQNVELSHDQLRIVFRTNESSSQDDNVSFEINPLDFVKTVYMWSDTSTKFMFRVLDEHLDCIKNDINGLMEASKQTDGGRIPKIHCWIIVETDPFSHEEQAQFEQIAERLIGCDKITPNEMDNLIESIMKTSPSNVTSASVSNVSNGDADDAGDGDDKNDSVTTKTKTKAKSSSATTKTTPTGGAAGGAISKASTIIEYPLNTKGAFSVTVQSYEYLSDREFLDDAIIDFYMEYIRLELMTAEQRERTHIFSVFFYSVLTARSSRGKFNTPGLSAAQRRHERVSKWTKDVDIFEKDFIIVPINSRSHWFLAIICFPSLDAPIYMDTDEPVPPKKRRSASKTDDPKPIKQPCILIFDSLGSSEKENVVAALRDYLSCEYAVKMKKRRAFDETTMPGQNVRAPGQPNLCDCGLFVLQNIEQFFKDPIKSFELPIKAMDHWYDAALATRKRKDIAELIQQLIPTHGTGFAIEDLPDIILPE